MAMVIFTIGKAGFSGMGVIVGERMGFVNGREIFRGGAYSPYIPTSRW